MVLVIVRSDKGVKKDHVLDLVAKEKKNSRNPTLICRVWCLVQIIINKNGLRRNKEMWVAICIEGCEYWKCRWIEGWGYLWRIQPSTFKISWMSFFYRAFNKEENKLLIDLSTGLVRLKDIVMQIKKKVHQMHQHWRQFIMQDNDTGSKRRQGG